MVKAWLRETPVTGGTSSRNLTFTQGKYQSVIPPLNNQNMAGFYFTIIETEGRDRFRDFQANVTYFWPAYVRRNKKFHQTCHEDPKV